MAISTLTLTSSLYTRGSFRPTISSSSPFSCLCSSSSPIDCQKKQRRSFNNIVRM
ncbi:hypothetical protein Bca4012_022290 [Brassica carinata]